MTLKGNLLLVEDEAIVAMSLAIELEAAGFRVKLASTARQGIEIARADCLRICVMDINLPGKKNGLEAAREIQTIQQVPTLFMTGYDDPEYRSQAMDCGAKAYLVKPMSPRDLRNAVEEVCARTAASP